MKMPRKYKVFEYTTQSYGKGYVMAGSEKSALSKALKRTSEPLRENMVSYYDKGTKKQLAKKYNFR